MRPPEGLTGKLWDLMPPLPLKGIDIYMLALNAEAEAEARHAVIARIKHLSLTNLEIGAIIVDPLG